MSKIQVLLDTLYQRQATKKSEFNQNRYALFFKPGRYALDVKVGYYMQVYGLGQSPDDVLIQGAIRSKSTNSQGHVLSNFWRSAENISVVPTVDSANIWGVSQAAPLRRFHVKGNLQLHDGGYASGGFMADSKIDGNLYSGQQQQWFSRNSNVGKWFGGAWNMMFMGVPDAPEGSWPAKPFTVIQKTPLIREKPYLVCTQQGFFVKVPQLRRNSKGPSWLQPVQTEKTLGIEDFYLVRPNVDHAASINQALKLGKNILFTPGIYSIDQSLKVTRPGTIIMGIGLTTLQSSNGNPIMEISDVDGITLCGLMMDAGSTPSETLLRVGESNSKKNHQNNPTFLYDVYFRVGGPFVGSTTCCLTINSNHVFVDNTWLWRADHGNGVGWDKNKAANGLVVNGDHVTVYGLFNEHFQEYQTLWNGNDGRVYFYQSEMPYDPPTIHAWNHDETKGFASYKVANSVKKHEAWGVGVYCVFYNAPVVVDRAIETPKRLERNFHHLITFWLNGNTESIIKKVINLKGDSVNVLNRKATL
ncbi:MAG TPA: glycoside hydrolase family 16 [Bacteroidales bacterium]|nr:glycoside hydrolase family 16 [Bacteroidales bacterium]